MQILIITIHVVVSLILILVVLLQTGKGADMGAAFGGGSSQTLFGATGASTFLSKTTTIVAIVFMLTSLILAYISSNRLGDSVMSSANIPVTQTAPVTDNTPKTSEANQLPVDQNKQAEVEVAKSQAVNNEQQPVANKADSQTTDINAQAQKDDTQKTDMQ